MSRSAVIVDAVRSPMAKGKPPKDGRSGGALSGVHPVVLLGQVIGQLMARNDVDPARVDDVIAGCVSQVGEQSGPVGRWAWLSAGLPESVPSVAVHRACGSSQQAADFAAQAVIAGACDIVVAAGVESMSRIPMFTARIGQDPYGPSVTERYAPGLVPQGISAELVAARWKLDRESIDEFSAASHAKAAGTDFTTEIVAVTTPDGAVVDTDETIRPSTTVEGLSTLKSAFYSPEMAARFPEITDWHITPGNSSQLADGAAAVLIMGDDVAEELGLTPRARFHAFAPVPMAWAQHFGADPTRLNPRGGAIALGHPLGASGARLLTTMLHALEATGGRFGLQTMCEAGGMANATIIERL